MNSYGDSSSPRGRAQIPGSNGGSGSARDDSYQRQGGADPYRPSGGSATGSAPPPRAAGSSGRASVGAAPVSPTPGSPASSGTASAGRARVGRASVPGDGGSAAGSGDGGGYGRPAGRAVVGGAPSGGTAGRASVGRAGVRPAANDGWGSGGAGGPGGPGGPGRKHPGDPDDVHRAKKRKRLNLIIAAFAVLIMVAGAGVVGFTYYSTTVLLPADQPLPLSTTIYASDGKMVVANLGDQNRQFVTINQIPEFVQHEVASAEDRNFYQHSGVDYAGIARAAWNNFTGGSKQGASTITQQYARNAYDNLKSDTYGRKIREAVLASKLNDKFDKPTIMQHYLNTIYFGRGAYGIEAAAKAYFGKPAIKLTVAEGAVLAGVIKQPVPDTSTGHKGFDPANNPQEAKDRWNYVLDGMVLKGWLDPKDKPLEYPKTLPVKPGNAMVGIDTPLGNVVNYVRDEMAQMGICTQSANDGSGKPTCGDALRDGGYKIKTSIDPAMQKAAEGAARRLTKGSVMEAQKKNLMAALVSVDPKTGRVVAYYGGDNGSGFDYAGKNVDSNGAVGGGHPPGSSFKVYTLAAAIDANISTQSHWDSTDYPVPGTKIVVRNATEGAKTSCGKNCTLEYSTLKSYNVPFYHITEKIGADKVIDMAKQAGITTMWSSADNPPKPYDLTKKSGKDLAPEPFFNVVGYGQYPITVLDHANGMATFANRGVYNKAHFVISVEQQNHDTGAWTMKGGEKLDPKRRIKQDVVDNVTEVLKKYPGQIHHTLDDGRPSTGKTGTWELNEKSNHNGHAWMVGYTPQLATAVWVGNVGPKQDPLFTKEGKDVYGSNVPADVWQRYMDKALAGKRIEQFPDNVQIIGDDKVGDGVVPVEPTAPPGCPDPLNPICQMFPGTTPGGGGNNGGGGPGGGGTPGGGGGGGGLLPSLSPSRN